MQSLILIRWPNEETGGHFRIPGCLVAPNTALAIFDGHVEVHLVEAAGAPGEYDLRYASNPLFYVGSDLPEIFYDLRHLTLAELAGKYTHSDFYSPERPLL
ncbi:hypothetical protein CBW65_15180 [Tumebacillus avium]|uniref:Uncharacterized protein n=1 Tax=Tumebacillus avium TaxID=1903704 RepID=A0A1Y0INR5_9BACL|nr:hypothetical protein [Tumebacillus avium]ARU62198.1 hypothetical protein CBW65_15180 [Tumebacillus avium]